MKLSTLLLGAMSVAVLSSCMDKSKNNVDPKHPTEQNGNNGGDPPADCPACGMG